MRIDFIMLNRVAPRALHTYLPQQHVSGEPCENSKPKQSIARKQVLLIKVGNIWAVPTSTAKVTAEPEISYTTLRMAAIQ